MKRVGGQFPHLTCRLRQYSNERMRQCVFYRAKKRKRTHLLFMGDSRIRQLAEVFLDAFRDLNFTVHTHEVSLQLRNNIVKILIQNAF